MELIPNKKRTAELSCVDLERLEQLWRYSDLRTEDVAIELGVSPSSVRRLVARHRIGRRPPIALARMREQPDPTPEEIVQRAAECRARRLTQPLDVSDDDDCV